MKSSKKNNKSKDIQDEENENIGDNKSKKKRTRVLKKDNDGDKVGYKKTNNSISNSNNNNSNSSNSNNNNNNNNNNSGKSCEKLFWSIFKNKVLFYEIFSNFRFSEISNYQRLKDANYILNNFTNGIDIIRDKVKSGGYLLKSSLNSVYNLIRKDRVENVQFYNQLFQNYPNYFSDAQELREFIKSTNLLAFKLFVKWFKIKNNQLFEIVMTSGMVKNYGNLNQSYYGIKMLNHLVEFHNFKMGEKLGYNLFENWALSNKLNLKQVVKLINLVSNLKDSESSGGKSSGIKSRAGGRSNGRRKNNNSKISLDSNKQYDSIQSFLINQINNINNSSLESNFLNDIESSYHQFSKLELSSNVFSMIAIVNYLNLVNSGNNDQHIVEFNNSLLQFKSTLYKIIYLFYTLFKNEELIRGYSYLENSISKFSGVLIDRKFIIKFLYNFLNSRNSGSGSGSNSISFNIISHYVTILIKEFKSVQIIQSVLQLDNLELIETIHQSKEKSTVELYYKSPFTLRCIINSIKSKEVLQFYYDNYQEFFFGGYENQLWQFVTNIQVMEHYELLMKDKKFLIETCFVIGSSFEEPMVLELLYRAFRSGGNSYQVSKSFNYASFSNIFSSYINDNKQDLVLSVFKLFIFPNISIPDYSRVNKVPVKILDWFVNNISSTEMDKLASFQTNLVFSLPTTPTIEFTVKSNSPTFNQFKECTQDQTKFSISYPLLLYLLMQGNRCNDAIRIYARDPRVIPNIREYATLNSVPYLNSFIHHAIIYYFELVNQYNNNQVDVINSHKYFENLSRVISRYFVDSSNIGALEIFKSQDIHQLTTRHLEFLDPILPSPKSLLVNAINSHSFAIVDTLIDNNITLSIDEFNNQFQSSNLILKLFTNKFK